MLVAVLFSNYGPYHFARINSFQTVCSQLGWDLVGIELARSEAEYQWKTKAENLPYKMISVVSDRQLESAKSGQVFSNLNNVLNQTRPDVIAIAGYARPAMLCALLWSIWNRKPAILFSASNENDAPRIWWREMFKSLLIKQYRAALAGGEPQKRYLLKLGMPADAVFVGYDVVGNNSFHPKHIKSLPRPLNKPFFLTINRFVPKKNLGFLISCYAAYRQIAGNKAWDLVICGDGPLRPQIEQQISDLSLEEWTHLPGFLQQDEMLPYFAHAGSFIHTSTQEQWGLVVNEAMAAGLPVLVSNRCGCFEDLVLEGINGFGFDPENQQELTQLMLKISLEAVNIEAMSQASLQHIQKYSPEYFAQNLMQAVKYSVAYS
jgi:1,2-diacylglycerol 3-alpha-glucosyltransferase